MKTITLYYDGECPICKRYSIYVRLREKYDVQIRNAREYIDEMEQFTNKGYNINQGMILTIDNTIYQGNKVITKMDELLEKKSLPDRLISPLIKIPYLVPIAYPFIKATRWILLKFLGVKKIQFNKK